MSASDLKDRFRPQDDSLLSSTICCRLVRQSLLIWAHSPTFPPDTTFTHTNTSAPPTAPGILLVDPEALTGEVGDVGEVGIGGSLLLELS